MRPIFLRSSCTASACLYFGVTALLLLAGCASLQIEVDVYKGALINTKDIQLRQYVSLATSAKPLLMHAALAAKKEYDSCHRVEVKIENKESPYNLDFNELKIYASLKKKNDSCGVEKLQSDFLCETRNLYEDKNNAFKDCQLIEENNDHPGKSSESNKNDTVEKGEVQAGLDTLTKQVLDELSKSPHSNGEELSRRTENLNRSMISFAQRILFFSNNQVLFKTFNQTSNAVLQATTPILQTLGNTILVHANDLQRQDNRDATFNKQAAAERHAMENVYRVPPSLVFDRIMAALESFSADATEAKLYLPEEERQLKSLEAARASTVQIQSNHLLQITPLLAAHTTLVSEPDGILLSDERNAADKASAILDRKTAADLFPSSLTGGKTAAEILRSWLMSELNADDRTEPIRMERLRHTLDYINEQEPRFPAATIENIRQRLADKAGIALTQSRSNMLNVAAKENALSDLTKKISGLVAERLAKQQKDLNQKRMSAQKTIKVVANFRTKVLAQAESSKIGDAAGVFALLKSEMSQKLAVASKDEADELNTALAAVNQLPIQATLCTPSAPSGHACNGDTPLAIIDHLIASLRAQRIQALSVGNGPGAANLLDAINAAHEQRTSLIYLRPASDYLRSVYTANAFQESAQKEYRNMLLEWLHYASPFNGSTSTRDQLEKLYWQNVNKVSVGGSGNTNYVLAKDDVGNWYVKAYSADPEAIIKSATSLALFNTGKNINTNLLRRNELRRRLDNPTISQPELGRLQAELDATNSQNGVTLLKVKQRYTTRYLADTAQQTDSVLAVLTMLPANLNVQLEKSYKEKSECLNATAKQAIDGLSKTYLDGPRTVLLSLSGKAAAIDAQEKALQSGLKAMHQYSGEVRLILAPVVTGCEEIHARAVSDIRLLLDRTLLSAINERKRSLERYEDGLLDIAAVGSAK